MMGTSQGHDACDADRQSAPNATPVESAPNCRGLSIKDRRCTDECFRRHGVAIFLGRGEIAKKQTIYGVSSELPEGPKR